MALNIYTSSLKVRQARVAFQINEKKIYFIKYSYSHDILTYERAFRASIARLSFFACFSISWFRRVFGIESSMNHLITANLMQRPPDIDAQAIDIRWTFAIFEIFASIVGLNNFCHFVDSTRQFRCTVNCNELFNALRNSHLSRIISSANAA